MPAAILVYSFFFFFRLSVGHLASVYALIWWDIDGFIGFGPGFSETVVEGRHFWTSSDVNRWAHQLICIFNYLHIMNVSRERTYNLKMLVLVCVTMFCQ